MNSNTRHYPDSALIDINPDTAHNIINKHPDMKKSVMSTYNNSPSTRPMVGDKVLYRNKEYFVTWVDFIEGRTLISMYKDNSIYMGIHISQVVFMSRCGFT